MKVMIEKLDHFGRGIAYINKKICFIKNALPEEIVEVEIVKEKKTYSIGQVSKYYQLSINRVNQPCPYYNECGGCALEHLDYTLENKFKQEKVRELLEKNTDIKEDIVEDIIYLDDYHYRNKIVLHVNNKKIGLFKEESNELIEIDHCLLIDNKLNALFPKLQELVKINDIKEITLRLGNITKEIMISIEGKVSNTLNLEKEITALIINGQTITKKDKILSIIDTKKYLITNTSFFQVNEYLTTYLYKEILNIIIANKCHHILDLYCGTGSIGLFISDHVDNVIGIEVEESSVKDAMENKKLNQVNNINFILGKVEDNISNIKDMDTIIVDPPRNGLKLSVIDNIKRIRPHLIIYISCDPNTLTRDLNVLKKQYVIEKVIPFNLFPRTYHVETITVLKLNDE